MLKLSMVHFTSKATRFINNAVDNKVIEETVANKLLTFLQTYRQQNKSGLSLNVALGTIASVFLILGIILIISHNWHTISDIIKISSFITMLGASHFTGLYYRQKGYLHTAKTLHFVGAFLVLCGIGLISQIFHLHSDSGEAFLLWFILIFPLAILLQSFSINLLSIVAFIIWGNLYTLDSFNDTSIVFLTFNASILTTVTLIHIMIRTKLNKQPIISLTEILFMSLWLYIFGFVHNFYTHHMMLQATELIQLWLPFTLLVISIGIICYLLNMLRYQDKKLLRSLLLIFGLSIITIILFIYAAIAGIDINYYIEWFSFGANKKTYILPLIISITAWFSYFALTIWGVTYGAMQQNTIIINCNLVLIIIGIISRFIDLIADMLNTGVMFIILSLLIYITVFFLARWRTRLMTEHIHMEKK